MNKKQLYESIMRSVSREVKKALNKSNIDSLNPHNFVIVDAWNESFDDLIDDYADALIDTDYGRYFLLPINVLPYCFKLNANVYNGEYDNDETFRIYQIPDDYKTLADVEEAIQNGVLNPSDPYDTGLSLFTA